MRDARENLRPASVSSMRFIDSCSFRRQARRPALYLALCFWGAIGLDGQLPLLAQHSVQWTTNYYRVSGAEVRELHGSMRQNRPWRGRHEADGFTEWKVEWRFHTVQEANGCRLTGFGTKTTVLVTLPRWVAPTNAAVSEVTSNAWNNFIQALGQHEAGHVSLALAAAPEMARRVAALPANSDCGALSMTLNQLGEQVLREYRERERVYDERTRHGLTQGAVLGFRPERERQKN